MAGGGQDFKFSRQPEVCKTNRNFILGSVSFCRYHVVMNSLVGRPRRIVAIVTEAIDSKFAINVFIVISKDEFIEA